MEGKEWKRGSPIALPSSEVPGILVSIENMNMVIRHCYAANGAAFQAPSEQVPVH